MVATRWSDNDYNFGPFTFSKSPTYRSWAIELKSRGDDDVESGQCTLRFTAGAYTFITVLPHIIKPWQRKVYPDSWDAATVERLGRNWYWNIKPRRYGFSYGEGFLQIFLGRETHDSSTEQSWSCFLPWTQWRHVRYSLYDCNGQHYWTRKPGDKWDAQHLAKEACPCMTFLFKDFDGELLSADTRIEEWQWKFGQGWFKWLSLFRRDKIRRSLGMDFSGETGREKGSWKGGTVGTGIDMLPGELHEAAFRRYCEEDHRSKSGKYRLTFIGPTSEVTPHDGKATP